ncbi:MAG: VWA domain-containing protein [Myxococcales bacterium]|nr:VWA domain-containing protein [Myxococcales bacterium]
MSRVVAALCVGIGTLLSFETLSQAGKCPNLVMLIDRSGSMLWNLSGNPQDTAPVDQQRWTIAKKGLTTIINQYDGKLPMGMAVFPTDNSCGVTNGLKVAPAYNTKQALLTALSGNAPDLTANTPTCSAMDALRQNAVFSDSSRQQYILLVTDGDPYCGNYTICGGGDLAAKTVTAITNAKNQSPAVKTFVVGFGGALPAGLKTNLNNFAMAGGVPNPDAALDYYPADNEQTLVASLDAILRTVTGGGDAGGGGSMLCDDSCYSNPCPNPSDVCVQGTCKANPCASISCPAGQYCFTDGSNARCVNTCTTPCDAGQRCILGECKADPCGLMCSPTAKCDTATAQCATDPACSGVLCKNHQGCFAGACKDDPCSYITCPDSLECVPFEGTCQPSGGLPNKPGTGGSLSTGCSCDMNQTHSHHAALVFPSLLLLGLLAARRRRFLTS